VGPIGVGPMAVASWAEELPFEGGAVSLNFNDDSIDALADEAWNESQDFLGGGGGCDGFAEHGGVQAQDWLGGLGGGLHGAAGGFGGLGGGLHGAAGGFHGAAGGFFGAAGMARVPEQRLATFGAASGRSRSVGDPLIYDKEDYEQMYHGGATDSMASFRDSATSFASSAWQSSCASFNSEAEGVPADFIMIGKRGQVEAIHLSLFKDVPKVEGNFLSLGSRLHDVGACTPCKFFKTKRGCRDGALCKRCHHPHKNESFSSAKRAVRLAGLRNRAFFESQAASIPPEMVKNTFIHFPGGDVKECGLRRSLSS